MSSKLINQPSITVTKILSASGNLLLQKFPRLLLFYLLSILRNILAGSVVLFLTIKWPTGFLIVGLTIVLLSTLTYFDLARNLIKIVRAEKIDIFPPIDMRIFSASIISTLFFAAMAITGLTLLIIPGLIIIVFTCLYIFAAVDRQGPIQSIKNSCTIVKKAFWQTATVGLLLFINTQFNGNFLLGGLSLAFGLQLMLAMAIIYESGRLKIEGANK